MTTLGVFGVNLNMETAQQIDLFGDAEKETTTIEAAAISAGVSTATIRNWIKTGYLVSAGRGLVSVESLEHFKKEVAGKEKLNARANKSLKDEHNHDFVTESVSQRLTQDGIDFQNLGEFYEESLSNSYRNKEGIYYTPSSIVSDLFSSTRLNLSKATFCDPCCGGGNFISQALKLGFKPENIYGYDIDPTAVKITKERIKREAGYASNNIKVADFLHEVVSLKSVQFDCIYTNPPWGKKIDKQAKEEFGQALKAGSSLDTCSLFFFACIESLKEKGELGLLLPEAFFNIATYEATRRKALNYSIERMVDYGKPFKGLVTKAQAITLRKASLGYSGSIS
ncbi:MAG: N-6 DNA methylase, partial [Coraliomargarita sp.]